jgi:hypothetical protein
MRSFLQQPAIGEIYPPGLRVKGASVIFWDISLLKTIYKHTGNCAFP